MRSNVIRNDLSLKYKTNTICFLEDAHPLAPLTVEAYSSLDQLRRSSLSCI